MACIEWYKCSGLVHDFNGFHKKMAPMDFRAEGLHLLWNSLVMFVLICTWNGLNVKVLGVSLVCQLRFSCKPNIAVKAKCLSGAGSSPLPIPNSHLLAIN